MSPRLAACCGRQRDPDAGPDVQHDVVEGDRLRAGSPAARCRTPWRRLRVDLVQDDGELVAAEPGEQVRGLQVVERGGEAGGHRLEQLVAGAVPERVVDLLEVVEVDQREAEAGRRARRLGAVVAEQRVQPAVERAPVRRRR